MPQQLEFTAAESVQLDGLQLTLKGILARIPDLAELYSRTFDEPSATLNISLSVDHSDPSLWHLRIDDPHVYVGRANLGVLLEKHRQAFPVLRGWRLVGAQRAWGRSVLVLANLPVPSKELGDDVLKYLIRQAAQGRPTMTAFLRRIREQRLSARPNIARNGRVSGISYRLDQVAVKGSQLGRSFTWTGLQRSLGVRYDRQRDAAAVEMARRATIGRDVEPRRGRSGRPGVAALRGLSAIRGIVRNPLRAAVTKLLPEARPVLKVADALRLGSGLVTSPAPAIARMVARAVLDKLAQREPHTCRGLTPASKRPPEN